MPAESNRPLVSVVIPAYNCEEHIEQALRSVIEQTLQDIEVICVDDGSTDCTGAILDVFAEHDSRVRVIHQANAGEGAARNAGLALARGRYLHFMDADDFLDRTMLKKMSDAAQRGDCDIVICGVSFYNTQTGKSGPMDWGCNWRAFPYGTFTCLDNPDDIFRCFQNWTWNKLFCAEFVEREGLRFDEVQRCADLYFVMCALVTASAIRCVPEQLYYYRTNNPTSNIATCDRAPLDFYQSFERTHDWLVRRGVYEPVAKAFRNWAIGAVFSNFCQLRSWNAFCELYDYLRADDCAALHALGLLDMEESDYQDAADVQKMKALVNSHDANELLFALFRSANARIEGLIEDSCVQEKVQDSVGLSLRQVAHAVKANASEASYNLHG